MISPLLMILISLSLAYLLSEVFRRMGLPRVAGQLITGLILGIGVIKSAVFFESNMNVLDFLANLGIILLFYYVGLETNIKAFTKNIKRSVLISLFNTSIPLVLGFLIMKFVFNFDVLVSLIIGIALSVSAQSVSVDILDELKMLKSKIGGMIISAGAVDDTIELILVTVLLSVFHIVGSKLNILRLFLDGSLFLGAIIIARIWVIPTILKFFDKEKSSTARFTGSLIIVLIISILSESLGVGLLIGALIAGMIIRQTIHKDEKIPNWEEHDIARSLHIIAFGFLIPLFFVWVGLNVDMTLILKDIGLIILLIAIATVGTVGGTILAVLSSKGKFKEGLILGWGLNPKGDIELVIATLALESGLINSSIFTSLVMMSLATTIISPIVFKYSILKYRFKR